MFLIDKPAKRVKSNTLEQVHAYIFIFKGLIMHINAFTLL